MSPVAPYQHNQVRKSFMIGVHFNSNSKNSGVCIKSYFHLKSTLHQSNVDFEVIHVKFMFNWKALEGALVQVALLYVVLI